MDREKDLREFNELQDRIADRHESRLLASIRAAMEAAAKLVPLGRPDIPDEHYSQIADAMQGLYREITRETAARMVDRFKSGFAWLETKDDEDGFYDRVYEEYLRRYGGRRIAQITETTRRQIVQIIERGLKAGLSVDEIAKEITEAAPIVAETRAHIISRTETHSAAMFASIESAKRSTLPLLKEWTSAEDGRTRDFGEGDGIVDEFSHRAMDGVRVPFDDAFEVPTRAGGTERLMYPGDPSGSAANIINCRCAVTYVPADEEGQEPTPRAEPASPGGSETERLLDKLRGAQPVFSQNHGGAFDKAPPLLLKTALKAGDVSKVFNDPKGAYADFVGKISMGKHVPGGRDYEHVFRHEYGHFVDLRMAEAAAGGKGPRARFASFAAVEELVEDGKELLDRQSKLGYGQRETDAAVRQAEKNRMAQLERTVELWNENESADDVLRAVIPEVEPEDVWKLYEATDRSKDMAVDIAAAWEARDVMRAIGQLPVQAAGKRVSHTSAFAGLQDTYEASNGAASSMPFGHGKNYYQRNNAWTRSAGLNRQIGRRRFNGYHTGQAFANWWDAYGDPNPAAIALYRRLFPRTAARFETMLEEFTDAT
jgi:hypothetical protein